MVLPYVQNEPIKCVLQQVGVGVDIKSVCLLCKVFCKPKDAVSDKENSGMVNKFPAAIVTQCTLMRQVVD